MNRYKRIVFGIFSLIAISSMAQTSPSTTSDFNLLGYPKTLRYMKFEADTNIKTQRTSFIEDYQLTFDNKRLLAERVNFISGQKDRSTTYEYNNKRQLVKETLKEKDGNIVNVTTYTYNNIGRLATATEVEYPASKGGANKTIRNEVYTYNTKGLLVEKDIHSDNSYGNKNIKYFYGPADSLISTVTTYSYNSNVDKVNYKRAFNNLLMEAIWFRNDQMIRRETYEWNDDAMLEKKDVYSKKDKKILSYTYTYDEHGNITSEVAIDNKNVKTIEYYYKYEKDKFFNWTKRTMYDGWDVKYTEIRSMEYFDKTHFYEDLKDADTGRIIRNEEE